MSQNSARAVLRWLILDLEHSRDPGDVFSPRQHHHGLHIRNGYQVRVVRALANVPCGKAGEAGAVGHHIVQRAGGNELGLGNATHFDEGTQKILDAFFLDECF